MSRRRALPVTAPAAAGVAKALSGRRATVGMVLVAGVVLGLWAAFAIRGRPVDFSVYFMAGALARGGHSFYTISSGAWTRLAHVLDIRHFTRPYRYPPYAAALLSLITPLGYFRAMGAWEIAGAAALVAGAVVLGHALGGGWRIALALFALLCFALLGALVVATAANELLWQRGNFLVVPTGLYRGLSLPFAITLFVWASAAVAIGRSGSRGVGAGDMAGEKPAPGSPPLDTRRGRRARGRLRAWHLAPVLFALAGGALLLPVSGAHAATLPRASGSPSASPSASPGPVTRAQHDVVAVTGTRTTLRYRVDDAGSSTASVTLVVTAFDGSVAARQTASEPVATGQDLTFTWRCDLPPGRYRFHFEAVDGAGLPQTEARAAGLHVIPVFPQPAAITSAIDWLRGRRSAVGFAVIDDRGKVRSYRGDAQFASASVVKAMLLLEYLRTHASLTSAMRATLSRMIIVSDNAAASAVYRVLGDGGLRRCASLVGMTHFAVHGDWALARITALDQARLFHVYDSLVPAGDLTWVRYLFSHITPSQRWGVPEVAGPAGWQVFFKGGYMPVGAGIVVHEVCRLERQDVVFDFAVLTGGRESLSYGAATLRGVTARLLAAPTGAPRTPASGP